MTSTQFTSAFEPIYAHFVEAGPSPAEAVSFAREYENAHNLSTPAIYGSTAITSAGYRRNASLDFSAALELNNLTARLIVTSLVDSNAAGLGATTLMLPTELGHVPNWTDSTYLIFYFCWLAGLASDGTAFVSNQMLDADRAPILTIADNRGMTNEQRWPAYRNVVEWMLSDIQLASASYGTPHQTAHTLLQLVDTSESLGCRAESMYSDARGLDRLGVTFADEQPGELAGHLRDLAQLGASVGIPRTPSQLVPLHLR